MKRFAILALLVVAGCSPKPAEQPAPASSVSSSSVVVSSAVSSSVVTQAELPPGFVGTWDADLKACSDISDMRLTVTSNSVDFWESTGWVSSVTVASPDDVTAKVEMSGEGEEWKSTLRLVLSDGGNSLTVTNDKTTATRVRCPKT